MVVSVHNTKRCLSLSDTIVCTEAVGTPDINVALGVNAAGVDDIGFHSKVFPFLTVAIKI